MGAFDGPRLVRREELVAAQQLRKLCFPGFVEDLGEKQVASYVPPRRGGTQVICHRGVPVSRIGIYHSRVNVYGSRVSVASIGGVCTHPDYRGQGLSTRLLDYCMRKLTADGARLLLISGTRGLYTRAGCVPAQQFEYLKIRPGEGGTPPRTGAASEATLSLRSEANGLVLRPATKADASLCARLYQTESVRFVRRVGDFVEHFSHLEEFTRAEDRIVEVGGRPVAYFFLSVPWEHLGRKDAGVREVFEYAGSRVALVGGLAEVMARLGLQELRLFVPWHDADLFQLLPLLGGRDVSGDRIPLFEHTMRIVDFPGLMSDLRGYVRARLTVRQRRGLRFEQEEDRYAIVRSQERLELDGAAMTQLIMGAPPDMAPDIASGPGALGEIVSALFPLPSFLPGLNFR
jgi:GNAT superfamily N-acetyltransferase